MGWCGLRSPIPAKELPRNTIREFLSNSSKFPTADSKVPVWGCIPPGKLCGVTEAKSAWRANQGRGAVFGLQFPSPRNAAQKGKIVEGGQRTNLGGR